MILSQLQILGAEKVQLNFFVRILIEIKINWISWIMQKRNLHISKMCIAPVIWLFRDYSAVSSSSIKARGSFRLNEFHKCRQNENEKKNKRKKEILYARDVLSDTREPHAEPWHDHDDGDAIINTCDIYRFLIYTAAINRAVRN